MFAIDLAGAHRRRDLANSCERRSGIAVDPALACLLAVHEGKIVALRTDTGAITGTAWPSDHRRRDSRTARASPPLPAERDRRAHRDRRRVVVGRGSPRSARSAAALLGFCATTEIAAASSCATAPRRRLRSR